MGTGSREVIDLTSENDDVRLNSGLVLPGQQQSYRDPAQDVIDVDALPTSPSLQPSGMT